MEGAPKGLGRWLRRLRWSLIKRFASDYQFITSFDGDMKIKLRIIDRLGKAVYLNGYSDRIHAQLLHRIIRPGMTYFDIGAHMGQFTLIASKRVGSTGHVHAFEATNQTYNQLKQNVELNNLSNTTLNNLAIFEKTGTLEIQTCVNGKGEFNAIGKPMRPDHEICGKEFIEGISIDAYCQERKIDHIDFLKIDTNGAELQVFRGARQTFAKLADKGVMMSVEFNRTNNQAHGYAPEDLKEEILSQGFSLYRLNTDQWTLTPEKDNESYEQTIDLIVTRDAERFSSLISNNS